ncbi:bifunctional hydroxymethylpyrimidine kinase/phosphomethylpyrimidine kinase, partial [uncultured Duncaniella sp.]|uniref:bifunctional hydroxymethylpyrimidine kinase/phosphomethylpyrimidine kinase n=1 Tax=uncultured Duncaniella sp. TaxID=2768039 RepID=UPI0026F1CFFA
GYNLQEFDLQRIDSVNTHGTGCTLSSAIAVGLAKGYLLPKAIKDGKEFVYNAIKHADNINVAKGPGPLNFLWRDNSEAIIKK